MNESNPYVKKFQSNWSLNYMHIISILKLVKIPSNRSLNFHNRYHCDPWCIHLLNKVKSKR